MSLHLLRKAHSTNYTAMRGMGDASPPEDGPLTECADCGGDGCECCDFKGYFFGDEPMSGPEYERFAARMAEDY